jgi:hypothetical protein
MMTITKRRIFGHLTQGPNLPEYEFDDPIPLDLLIESISDKEFVTLCCETVLITENQRAEFARRVSPNTRQTYPWHVSHAALQQVKKTELARQRAIILEICK